MFTKVAAKKTTDWLVQGGRVKEEDRVVYEFGLDKLFSTLINFPFAALLGLLFGALAQAVVFYLAYILLRVYAGGDHAEKPLTCFFASIAILIPCLVAIRFYQAWITPVVFWGLLAVSIAILIVIAPVEHKNKVLEPSEKTTYCRRMLRNLAIITSVTIGLQAFSLDSYAVALLCGTFLAAITATIGKMRFALQVRSELEHRE